MSDHETESFTPYEPQTSYDWDYGEEPPPERGDGGGPNNVLWGRLIALGALVLIVFFIGRWSAPDGADPDDVRKLRGRYERALDEVEELKAELTQPTIAPTPSPSITVGEQTDEAEDETFDGETYIVQSGDTIREIAERYCGDPTKYEVIAEFNGLDDPTLISVGLELKIPEECKG